MKPIREQYAMPQKWHDYLTAEFTMHVSLNVGWLAGILMYSTKKIQMIGFHLITNVSYKSWSTVYMMNDRTHFEELRRGTQSFLVGNQVLK